MGSAGAAMDEPEAATHLLENDGRIGFVLLRLIKEDTQNFAQNGEAIVGLKRLVAQMRTRHPQVKIGLTGLPIIEYDEMQSSESSMSLATILSFLGVLAVLIVAFGGFRHSLLGDGGVGGGHDLGLRLRHADRRPRERPEHRLRLDSLRPGHRLRHLLRGPLPGTPQRRPLDQRRDGRNGRRRRAGHPTGAVTSAIAFFATGLTEFSGVAQLGIIAGGGVLLCWLAQMTVLPAMIRLVDRYRSGQSMPLPLDLRLPEAGDLRAAADHARHDGRHARCWPRSAWACCGTTTIC